MNFVNRNTTIHKSLNSRQQYLMYEEVCKQFDCLWVIFCHWNGIAAFYCVYLWLYLFLRVALFAIWWRRRKQPLKISSPFYIQRRPFVLCFCSILWVLLLSIWCDTVCAYLCCVLCIVLFWMWHVPSQFRLCHIAVVEMHKQHTTTYCCL